MFSQKTQHFGNWMFPSSGKMKVAPTLLVPIAGPAMETDPVSETLCFLRKHWTMDKVQKHDSFKALYLSLVALYKPELLG
jgi:hypothetical protein